MPRPTEARMDTQEVKEDVDVSKGEPVVGGKEALAAQPEEALEEKHEIDIMGNLDEEKEFARELREHGDISSTIIENPRAQLDFYQEFELYRERILSKRNSEDKELIEKFSQQINLRSETRTITVMPVYVREDKLSRALESYKNLNAEDLKEHHVVLFLNAGSDMSQENYSEHLKSRQEEIAAFVQKNPEVSISVIENHFSEKVVLGRARGLMADAVMTKAHEQKIKDPIFVSNDADQIGMAVNHLRFVKREYDEDSKLDAAGCTTLWSGYDLNGETITDNEAKMPEVWLGDLFSYASDGVVRNGEAGIPSNFYTCGPNSNFRAAALCAMGGYDYSLGFKEEVEIGRRAKAMRMSDDDDGFYHKEHFRFIKGSWVATSPRRAIRSIIAGGVLLTQWDDFDAIVGADMDEKVLTEEYVQSSDLLQLSDLQKAREGDQDSINKIRDRISEVLMKLFEADSVTDQARFEAILNRIGFQCIAGSTPDNLTVDLENSPLYEFLLLWGS